MKNFCISLMTMVSMVLSANAVAQTQSSVNEYGETIDEFGGIIAPPAGDSVKFKRVGGTAVYKMNSSKHVINPQRGSALMVICNDSVYYWKSPLSWLPDSRYWMKGLYDKTTQTVVFAQGQANYYHPNDVVSTLVWCVRDPQASSKYKIATDYADAFVFDMKGDTLTLRNSEPFNTSTTEPAYFMGGCYGSSFIKVGDGATQLVRQYPVEKRDTVHVTAIRLHTDYQGANGDGYTIFTSQNEEYNLVQLALNGDRKTGTFATLGINYSKSSLTPAEGEKIKFYDGELTIFEDNEGYKMQGVMIGTDEKAYVINLIQPAGTYDMDAFVDLNLTIPMDSVVIKNVGLGCFELSAELRDYMLELKLFANMSATDLPAGEYIVSDTYLPGTAQQSTGYIDPEAFPCFVIAVERYSDENAYTNNMWFFVSGSITVNEDGSMLAVGKNSYGKDIRIMFTPQEASGLLTPNLNASSLVRKVMQHGLFYIRKGNKSYNLLGAPISH